MSRTLSAAAAAAAFAQQTGEAMLFLVKISHADWGSDVCMVNNNVDIVSSGTTYTAFPFDISMPPDNAEREARTTLKVCNVSREIIVLLRALSTAPTVTVSLVLGSTPDTVEAGPWAFTATDYGYDQFSIEATLAYEDVLSEPIPKDTFNPSHFAGLFG